MIDDQGNSWEPGVFPRVTLPPFTAPDDGPYSLGFQDDVVRDESGNIIRHRNVLMRRCSRCSGVFNDVGMTPTCPYCGSTDTIGTVASAGVNFEQVYRAIDAMEPGKFMDICVAREVFEVHVFELPEDFTAFEAKYPGYFSGEPRLMAYPCCVGIETPEGRPVNPHPLRFYSTREEDAWRVVSMMTSHSKDLTMRREGRMYRVGFCAVGSVGQFVATNAPEAVCKAALFHMRTHEKALDPDPPAEEQFGVQGAL